MRQIQRLLTLITAAGVLAACGMGGGAATPANETTIVRRGNLTVTVSSNGTVQPAQSADLSFGVSGTVAELVVDAGQQVKAGQPLAKIDPRDLEQQVVQAEANLRSAQAQLEQARSGNATDADLEAQAASVRSAEANLDKTRTGGTTAADIRSQEAAVRSAQAGLVKAQTGNVKASDIANAEASVRAAEANLEKVRTGNITQADIISAEASVRAAEAQLQQVQSGPTPDQVSAAQTQLAQAQQNYQKTAAQAAATKSSAEQSMLQAADAVRLAQETYSSAFWDNDQAQRGIDPTTGREFAESVNDELQQQQYAEALRRAELQLSQAQSQLEQAKVSFENAKQQEINDVATAQVQVDDAQVQLNEVLKGPKAADVIQAQTTLDQARANLQKLQQGGTPADIASAQAQLDQARATLAGLRSGGTAADIAQARATLDQAQAQLQKLRQGGTAADVASAQAQVDQAQAQFEKLSAGSAPSDISIAEAGVTQAEAQLKAAQLDRDKATLTAPFDGIVTVVNVGVGDSASAGETGGTAITVVDLSSLHIDVYVGETDIASIAAGQPATITVDALDTQPISGTVEYVAPAATVEQDVTTYLVRVALPEENTAIRVGMSALVEIAVAEQPDVLLVPVSAVRSEGGQRFVRLQRGDTFVDQPVRLGMRNDLEVEVLEGLSEGDVIAVLGTAPTTPQP